MLTFQKNISQFNNKKYSPEDRLRLRELRFEIRKIWYPPRDDEIKQWRRRVGINSSLGILEFTLLTREEKEIFFRNAKKFIKEIEKESIYYFYRVSKQQKIKPEDEYDILGLKPDADLIKVKKQYRQLVLKHHPDHGGNPEKFIKINLAYKKITGLKTI